MVVTRRLIRNGSSVAVTIPRAYLHHLNWILGREVVVELLEDGSLWIRVPTARDWATRSAGVMPDAAPSPKRL